MSPAESSKTTKPIMPVTFEGLSSFAWLRHGFTPRAMGSMAISPERFHQHGLPQRIVATLRSMGMDPRQAVLAHQVHSDRVALLRHSEASPRMMDRTDALITAQPGVPLVTFGADCPNIFLVDTSRMAIGLVHSGRLGTLAGVLPKTVQAMVEDLDCRVQDMLGIVSPSVGPCCYPTDLWGALESQLKECGLRYVNARECTSCQSQRFYSYRRSKDSVGRMMAALMLL